MSTLHASSALLPEGWTSDVRIAIEGGAITAIERGAPPREGDERYAIAVPALANLHSHAFQRAMAGLTEIRGPGAELVLDLARDDVPFRADDVARRRRGGRRSGLC